MEKLLEAPSQGLIDPPKENKALCGWKGVLQVEIYRQIGGFYVNINSEMSERRYVLKRSENGFPSVLVPVNKSEQRNTDAADTFVPWSIELCIK